MTNKRLIEISVGLFMIAGLLASLWLAYKVSGLDSKIQHGYYVTAEFDHIGALKKRAPVTIAGVRIGEVKEIKLDSDNLKANVSLLLEQKHRNIPEDSSASILTEGLLGSSYIAITPGFGLDEDDKFLKEGSLIEETNSAIILENLIGQLLFSANDKDS